MWVRARLLLHARVAHAAYINRWPSHSLCHRYFSQSAHSNPSPNDSHTPSAPKDVEVSEAADVDTPPVDLNQPLRLLIHSYPMQRAMLAAGVQLRDYRRSAPAFCEHLVSKLPDASKAELVCEAGIRSLVPFFVHFIERGSSPSAASPASSNPAPSTPKGLAKVAARLGVTEQVLASVLDLRQPHEWFPAARAMRRRIVVHAGPTNSGKTHAAINALANAESGVYGGPLRLLAWEIYERLTARGVACDLLTGQEVIRVPGAKHYSSTMELCQLSRPVQVAVLDELQMVGDEDRGFHWTRALLGVPAQEVHVCGDPSLVPVVKALATLTGDEVVVNTYSRLSQLKMDSKPLRSLQDICAGDCIIAFSRSEVYRIKREIEASTAKKCCIIYGSLPAETRKQQAQLFNDPDSGHDVLVATDAIGMGLNLNIRRIIFSDVEKNDGTSFRQLYPPEVKQIAGRAGRYRSDHPIGYVTAFTMEAYRHIEKCLRAPPQKLRAAGIFPPVEMFEELYNVVAGIGAADDSTESAKKLHISPFLMPSSALNEEESNEKPTARQSKSSMEPMIAPVMSSLMQSHQAADPDQPTEATAPTKLGSTLPPSSWELLQQSNQQQLRAQYAAQQLAQQIPFVVNSVTEPASPTDVPTPPVNNRPTSGNDVKTVTLPRNFNERLNADRSSSPARTSSGKRIDFAAILNTFAQHASLDGSAYFMCDPSQLLEANELIENVPLDIKDRFLICMTPVRTKSALQSRYFVRFVQAYASGELVPLGLTVNTGATPQSAHDMHLLEDAHGVLEMYVWLARHFPAHFFELETALEFKERSSQLIQHGLETISDINVDYGERRRLAHEARERFRAKRRESGALLSDQDNSERQRLHQSERREHSYRKSTFFEAPPPTPRRSHGSSHSNSNYGKKDSSDQRDERSRSEGRQRSSSPPQSLTRAVTMPPAHASSLAASLHDAFSDFDASSSSAVNNEKPTRRWSPVTVEPAAPRL